MKSDVETLADVDPQVVSAIVNYKDLGAIDFRKSPVRATLALVIGRYESDTFSASGSMLTDAEAFAMADVMLRRLVDMVACGGRMHSDGDALAEILEQIRQDTRKAQRAAARA